MNSEQPHMRAAADFYLKRQSIVICSIAWDEIFRDGRGTKIFSFAKVLCLPQKEEAALARILFTA